MMKNYFFFNFFCVNGLLRLLSKFSPCCVTFGASMSSKRYRRKNVTDALKRLKLQQLHSQFMYQIIVHHCELRQGK